MGPSLLNLLLLLNIAGVSGSLPVTVSGFLGEQVVLPCTYKGIAPVPDLQVIWRIPGPEVVHKFVDGSDDLTQQDPRFRNRTNLFKDQLEHGNWSVLLSDLRESDQNKYDCLIFRRTGEGFDQEQAVLVHLSVTERARSPVPNTPAPGSLPVAVSGFLGGQVVLPCTYKGNVPDLQVVWQIPGPEVVHKFVNGNDDLTQQDPRFRKRTNLFKDQLEHGNWSVLLSDLRQSDQNEYECLILRRTRVGFYWEQDVSVHLSVAERARSPVPNTPAPDPGLSTGAAVGLGIVILTLLTLAVIGVFLIRKRQWKQNRDSSNPEAASNGGPLTNVPCSDEARSLVTTAAEHQTRAAGEQNLLVNLAVQR